MALNMLIGWMVVACITTLTLVVYVRRAEVAEARSLFVMGVTVVLWSAGEVVGQFYVTTQESYWISTVVLYTGGIFFAPAWWFFALSFARLSDTPSRWSASFWRFTPFAYAGVMWIFLITNPVHGLFVSAHLDKRNEYHALWYTHAIGTYFIVLLAISVFVRIWWNGRHSAQRRRAGFILAASLAPIACNLPYVTRLIDPGFDPTIVGLSVTALSYYFGIYRPDLFAFGPVELRHLLEHETDGVLLADQGGRCIYANPPATQMLPTDASPIGEDVFSFLAGRIVRGDGSEQPVTANAIRRTLIVGPQTPEDHVYEMRDGRWLQIDFTPIPESAARAAGMGFRLRDVTERKNADAALRNSERSLSKAQELAHVGSWEWDLRTDTRTRSAEVCRICGLDPDDMGAGIRDGFELIHPDDRQQVMEAGIEAMLARRPQEVPYRIVHPDGSIRHVIDRSEFEYDDAGNAVRQIGAMLDVTEQVLAKQIQAQLETQLRQSQKMQAIGTLIAGMTHDINNILSPILLFAHAVTTDLPPESSLRRDMDGIVTAARRGRDLVNHILSAGRPSHAERRPISVGPIVRETMRLFQAGLPPTIDLRVTLTESEATTLGDPTQIQQVLLNLCNNAAQAMPSGGRLQVTLSRDVVQAGESGDVDPGRYVRLTVQDTGTGMTAETIERLWEPYFTTKAPSEGTGLGLAVVHNIVKMCGGHLTVDSVVDRGTTVSVYFPESATDPTGETATPPEPGAVNGHEHVLMVDNEAAARASIARILTSRGYEVTLCATGQEALERLGEDPERYDAVLTDLRMPEMTGLQLIERMRSLHYRMPVVLCTGVADDMIAAGINGGEVPAFVRKPVESDDLNRALRRALDSDLGPSSNA